MVGIGWLFGWLILNVPVHNFSVMLGRSHRFLRITSTFWGVNVPCSRTQHGLTRVGLEPPTSGSGVQGLPPGHRAPPVGIGYVRGRVVVGYSRVGYGRIR